MKLLLIVVSLCLFSDLWAADDAASVVSSVEDMTSKGVTFYRLQLQTPGASVEIETLVASGRAVGEYEFTECVVLQTLLSVDRLAAMDSATDGADPMVARRSKSTQPRSVFLVRGNEIPKAYFAFVFSSAGSSGAKIVRRYLVPVSAIKRSRPNPPAEPERTAAAAP